MSVYIKPTSKTFGACATIVIGNGFDRHLGLLSSFNHFFESCCLTQSMMLKNNITNIIYILLFIRFYGKGLPVDGFIRKISKNNINWMDVESFLKKIALELKMILYNCYKKATTGKIAFTSDAKLNYVISRLSARELNKDEDDSYINKLLKDDLIQFESDFSKYLSNLVKKETNYSEKQNELINKIALASQVENYEHLQIINFNYIQLKATGIHEENVHGTLDSKIVIGYDSTDKNYSDQTIIELSKEWQKIDVDIAMHLRLTSRIIIYGHSLGEQDYPFFFSLFDKYNVVSKNGANNVGLMFCHSLEGEDLDLYKINATKLLTEYGNYLNRNGGERNIIVTELKRDGRIIFVKID